MSLLDRLFRRPAMPPGLVGRLEADENVLASAPLTGREGELLVATTHGLWLPEGRRVGWHLVSKATWTPAVLTLIEARGEPVHGGALILTDLPPRRLPLEAPGAVPSVVHQRVTGSIRSRHHRELPGGGAWFVQRKVPGRDGFQLQVRPDPGTDERVVREVAAQVVAALPRPGE